MPIDTNDFLQGLDPSVLPEISGSQLLQLIREATPSETRGIIIVSNDTPDVATYPRFKRFFWVKPIEDNKIIRVYNENTSSWEPVIPGNDSIDTQHIKNGAITLDKLFNPNDITKAGWLIRVNASGDGWELFKFVIQNGSITLDKFGDVTGNKNKFIRVKSDETGWEFVTITDLAAALPFDSIPVSSLVSTGIAPGSIIFVMVTGERFQALPPGAEGTLLRIGSNGLPVWYPSQNITTRFTKQSIIIPPNGGLTTLDPLFPTSPEWVRAYFKCINPELGYSENDYVSADNVNATGGVGPSITVTLKDAPDPRIYIVFFNANYSIVRKDTFQMGQINKANWEVWVHAGRLPGWGFVL